MRRLRNLCLVASLMLASAAALASEAGQVIRAGDLMSGPFIDAEKAAKVKAKQNITILERKGGWLRVETNGQTGWIRSLNVRLAAGSVRPGAASADVAQLRTGSSGRTVTTGIKGLDQGDIRNASPDYVQLAQLDALVVDATDAKRDAQEKALTENEVAYLRARGTK